MNSQPPSPTRLPASADAALRLALLAALWALLAGGAPAAWIVGAPVVLAAAWLSTRLNRSLAWRWSWTAAGRFAWFFLRESVLGGMDVAWRALHPRLPLRPGFVTVELRLPPGAARVCLANVISLLPGTLAARLDGARLLVHTVDTAAPVERGVRAAEAHVAALFAVPLTPDEGGPA